jgi:hypothetical protein
VAFQAGGVSLRALDGNLYLTCPAAGLFAKPFIFMISQKVEIS